MISGIDIAKELTQWIENFNQQLYVHDEKSNISIVFLTQKIFLNANEQLNLLIKLESIRDEEFINFLKSLPTPENIQNFIKLNPKMKQYEKTLLVFTNLPLESKIFIKEIITANLYTIGYLVYTLYLLYILATLKIFEAISEINPVLARMYASSNTLEKKINCMKISLKEQSKNQKHALEQATGINELVMRFIKDLPQYNSLRDEQIAIALYDKISNFLLLYTPILKDDGQPHITEMTFELIKNFREAIITFLEKIIHETLRQYMLEFDISEKSWVFGKFFRKNNNPKPATSLEILNPIIKVLGLLEKIYNLELANFNPKDTLSYSLGTIKLKSNKKIAVGKLSSALQELASRQLAPEEISVELEATIHKIDEIFTAKWREAGWHSKRVFSVLNILEKVALSYSNNARSIALP